MLPDRGTVGGYKRLVTPGVFGVYIMMHYSKVWAFIQVDVKNAFNSASRAHTLTQIAMFIPEMYNFILKTYSLQHKLWMNVPVEQIRTFIIAGEGSPQVAVDGSFFFALAINYILIKMNNCENEWRRCIRCNFG